MMFLRLTPMHGHFMLTARMRKPASKLRPHWQSGFEMQACFATREKSPAKMGDTFSSRSLPETGG